MASSAKTATIGPDGKPEKPDTNDEAVVRTIAYVSPEQAERKSIAARSDVFSFRSMRYEMITGRRAFRDGTLRGRRFVGFVRHVLACVALTPQPNHLTHRYPLGGHSMR